ncbi:hypothetical protein HYX16_00470 [Candidatus Woesearchaeota archaeon]|nr:hypothetical protein [Candidatus Woesearchaeota archaeon]
MDGRLEVRRKIAHILLGLTIVSGLYFKIIEEKYLFFAIIFVTVLSLLSAKFKLPVVSFLLRKFERENLLNDFPFKGALFFLGGALLTIRIFSKDIAMASIMILTFGDSVSFLFGKFLGKIRLKFNDLKNLEGILAGMLAAFIGSLFFVNIIEAFFASLMAMFIEGAGFKIGVSDVDDNLIVPLVAGTVIYLFRTNFVVFRIF